MIYLAGRYKEIHGHLGNAGSNVIGGRDEESVIQFGHGNWMEFVFLWIMLSRQIPELLCLVVLCGSLFVVKRFERRAAGM
jgi:hypothetical protein